MLKIVHSPLPAITPEVLPEELAGFVQRVFERPWACWWLVPTGRRRRALARDWLRMRDGHSSGRQASLLPERLPLLSEIRRERAQDDAGG